VTRHTAPPALLVLALLFTPSILSAQGGATLGVELGYTRAGFSGRDSRGVTLREGAVAGAYFQVALNSWLAIRPGIHIASKGGATSVVTSDSTQPVRFELDLVYLDFPVVLRARIPAIGRTRLILATGAVPGLRIGCNVELSQGGFTLVRSVCSNATGASFRSWDFELLGGAGFGIPIEGSELALEARFTQGLRSVSSLGDIKNRAWTLAISVPF
jgi:Outer membrane protein beta-barrel domain